MLEKIKQTLTFVGIFGGCMGFIVAILFAFNFWIHTQEKIEYIKMGPNFHRSPIVSIVQRCHFIYAPIVWYTDEKSCEQYEEELKRSL